MKNVMIVAAHKPYELPKDRLYLPVQAGAACHPPLEYTRDDTGDQISRKNDLYCELTALYWGWKNLAETGKADALGLCHYRRYFEEPGKKAPMTAETAERLLAEAPVILPKKRNYWIETGWNQFAHAHGEENIRLLRGVLLEKYPAYTEAFDRSMARTAGHRFNMLMMRREQLNAYCAWLFDILFETERRMENPKPRMMGYLAERLTDAWVETTGTPYRELKVYHTEKTNWLKKGGVFLLRKVRGR